MVTVNVRLSAASTTDNILGDREAYKDTVLVHYDVLATFPAASEIAVV